MAVAAAGVPILLQTAPGSLGDFVSSLRPGDLLTARVIAPLNQNQALISVRGQTTVAQVPAGLSLSKGSILSLQVSQADPGAETANASLVMKLLSVLDAQDGAAGEALGAAGSAATSPPGFGQLEQALGAAKLPVNAVNLALAQTLSRLGAPLDAQTLRSLSQSVETLISNEQAPSEQAYGSALGSESVRQVLQDGLAQLKVAAQLNPFSEQTVALAQAARSLEQALGEGGQGGGGLQSDAAEGRAWDQDIAQALQNLLNEPGPAQASTLAALLDQAGGSPAANAGAASVFTAPGFTLGAGAGPSEGASGFPAPVGLQAGANGRPEPSPASADAGPLGQAFASGAAAELSSPASLGNPAPAGGFAPPLPPAGEAGFFGSTPSGAPLAANSADIPAMREALAQWLGPMGGGTGSLSAGSLAESAQTLAQAFSNPVSAQTQRLVASVQAQAPQAGAEAIQNAGARALLNVADFYGQFPADRAIPGTQALRSDLGAQGLPVPAADLSSLAPETVATAVAWLNARGLPPQRPLVETVAAWMDQDRNAMPAAQKALQSQEGLTEVLDARPSLKQAYASLRTALDSAGLDPNDDALAARLQAWATDQGLALESELGGTAGAAGAPTETADAAPAAAAKGASLPASAAAAPSLRGSLLRLQNELSEALQSAQSPSPGPESSGLGLALRAAQAAVRGFNALPLQAQSAPAFDTVQLPLPVWMNGALGEGRLSVTWRRGRERGLDEREPVNVAVSLNTENLGPVTVTLQVWKNAASARVLAQDTETADFLSQGADALRSDFSQNTPFELRALDFAAGPASAGRRGDTGETEMQSPGLSLSA